MGALSSNFDESIYILSNGNNLNIDARGSRFASTIFSTPISTGMFSVNAHFLDEQAKGYTPGASTSLVSIPPSKPQFALQYFSGAATAPSAKGGLFFIRKRFLTDAEYSIIRSAFATLMTDFGRA